jgi:hypothetical protein
VAQVKQHTIDKNVYAITELATLLKSKRQDSFLFNGDMVGILADWLEELHTARTAVYEARVALAKTRGY